MRKQRKALCWLITEDAKIDTLSMQFFHFFPKNLLIRDDQKLYQTLMNMHDQYYRLQSNFFGRIRDRILTRQIIREIIVNDFLESKHDAYDMITNKTFSMTNYRYRDRYVYALFLSIFEYVKLSLIHAYLVRTQQLESYRCISAAYIAAYRIALSRVKLI